MLARWRYYGELCWLGGGGVGDRRGNVTLGKKGETGPLLFSAELFAKTPLVASKARNKWIYQTHWI